MREERQAQYLRAIDQGIVDDGPPSRRRRHKILAVDRDDDIAAVLVATRGKRHNRDLTTHLFTHEHGDWVSMGSGGSGSDDPRTPERSTVPPRSITITSTGATGSGRSAVHDAVLRVGTDVDTLRWRDSDRTVATTGYAVVVWRGREAPTVTAYDAAGRVVDRLERIDSGRLRLPWHVAVRRALTARRHRGEWFNYAARR